MQNIQIADETEITEIVIVNQRAYEVPRDVARACNAHDDLVAALADLLSVPIYAEMGYEETLIERIKAAQAALTKAEQS